MADNINSIGSTLSSLKQAEGVTTVDVKPFCSYWSILSNTNFIIEFMSYRSWGYSAQTPPNPTESYSASLIKSYNKSTGILTFGANTIYGQGHGVSTGGSMGAFAIPTTKAWLVL